MGAVPNLKDLKSVHEMFEHLRFQLDNYCQETFFIVVDRRGLEDNPRTVVCFSLDRDQDETWLIGVARVSLCDAYSLSRNFIIGDIRWRHLLAGQKRRTSVSKSEGSESEESESDSDGSVES